MMPEEVVQAGLDLKANIILPIHNSKYILSLHAWYAPLAEVTTAAKDKNLTISTPQIGQSFFVNRDLPQKKWWEE